jgi:hypothetical protein
VPVVRRPTGRPAGIAIVVAFLAGPGRAVNDYLELAANSANLPESIEE